MKATEDCRSEPMKNQRTKWSDDLVASRISAHVGSSGRFPTISELKSSGQSDLANQICRRGGVAQWANRLGLRREESDSSFGWAGESKVKELLELRGFSVALPGHVKWPFDLLVNDCLRVDVKTASFASYGRSEGWFFRIGKAPQADLIALYRADTEDAFLIPWRLCPTSNITITPTGDAYTRFLNAFEIVAQMSASREIEVERWKP